MINDDATNEHDDDNISTARSTASNGDEVNCDAIVIKSPSHQHRSLYQYKHNNHQQPKQEHDEPSLVFLSSVCQPFEVHIKDDLMASHLQHALKKDKTLTQLDMTVWASHAVSTDGMKALAQGIQASAVESLSIQFFMRFNFGRQLPKDLIRHVYPRSVIQNLRELNIHYDLDNADMVSLGKELRNNTSLEKLSLSVRGVQDKDGTLHLFDALQQGTNISHLVLRGARPRVYTILFDLGVMVLSALRHLCLDNEGLNFGPEQDEAHGVLRDKLSPAAVSQVKTLILDNCPFKVKDKLVQLWLMQSMTKIPHLTELTLKDHELDAAGLNPLIKALANHRCLKKLDLSLDDSQNSALSRQQMNGMFYDGRNFPLPPHVSCATTIINHFRCGLVLRELNLCCRRVQTEGLHQLVQATSTYPFIKSIELRDNGIGLEGLNLIARALVNSKLCKLRVLFFLPRTSDPNDAKAQKWGCDAAARAFRDAVQSNMCLQEILVQDENILRAFRYEIDFYLKLNKYGRQLLLQPSGEPQIPAGLWAHVLAKHRNNADLLGYLVREQPLLVQPPKSGNITKR